MVKQQSPIETKAHAFYVFYAVEADPTRQDNCHRLALPAPTRTRGCIPKMSIVPSGVSSVPKLITLRCFLGTQTKCPQIFPGYPSYTASKTANLKIFCLGTLVKPSNYPQTGRVSATFDSGSSVASDAPNRCLGICAAGISCTRTAQMNRTYTVRAAVFTATLKFVGVPLQRRTDQVHTDYRDTEQSAQFQSQEHGAQQAIISNPHRNQVLPVVDV